MITYVHGDATRPATIGSAVIVHVVNDIGAWGAGFVLALSRQWPEPEAAYRAWSAAERQLGAVQLVPVKAPSSAPCWVANLVGQHDIRRRGGTNIPVRYDAIETGLQAVAAHAVEHGASAHMPRIGCGLAGGTWDQVEPLIERTLVSAGVDVTVYDLA